MSDQENYIAYHGEVYLRGCVDSHQLGLRASFTLGQEEDYERFKGFRKRRRAGGGSGGMYRVLLRARGVKDWTEPVDVIFRGWSLSSAKGAVVVFEFAQEDYPKWFLFREMDSLDRGCELEQLAHLEMVCLELDDEGKPVNCAQREKLERMAAKGKWPTGGVQSKRAARLCREDDFKFYVAHKINSETQPTDEEAAAWLRKQAVIDTRAQLDHDALALERFEDRVMRPYLAWVQA